MPGLVAVPAAAHTVDAVDAFDATDATDVTDVRRVSDPRGTCKKCEVLEKKYI